MKNIAEISKKILFWYYQNKRNLPWRQTRDPYRILVSEIMLQQTQVDRVIPKYRAFLKTFPTVRALARAKIGGVIRAWQGLGYNRRALFLHKAAQTVVAKYSGRFPVDLELLKQLPGIGDYTARAVLSFAFDLPVAVLDTNHRNFYQRTFFGMRRENDTQLLRKGEEMVVFLLNHHTFFLSPPYEGGEADPARGWRGGVVSIIYHWNQALMDFMSAVARGDPDPLVAWYMRTYPAVPCKNIKTLKHHRHSGVPPYGGDKNMPTVRFEDTDRYARGRIVDALRLSRTVPVRRIRKMFPNMPSDRFQHIVRGLQKDGLIKRWKKDILLP